MRRRQPRRPPPGYYDPYYGEGWVEVDEGPNRVEVLPNEVPDRVRVAFHALEFFYRKAAPVLVPKEDSTGGGHELHNGQELHPNEEKVLDAACKLLYEFFNGAATPDVWEGARLQAARINMGQSQDMVAVSAATPMRCHCVKKGGNPNPGCGHCRGSGMLLTFPAVRVGECPGGPGAQRPGGVQ